MNIWRQIMHLSGWSTSIGIHLRDKCVICVAPHTSNLDFLIGLCAYKSLGRNANFLMKKFWFFFPLGILLKKLGGIPVDRSKKTSLTDRIVHMFRDRTYLNLAVTPEGTRSPRKDWHSGFLYIANKANVPILLAVIDYSEKRVIIDKQFITTGDAESDMNRIRRYYDQWAHAAKKTQNFCKLEP